MHRSRVLRATVGAMIVLALGVTAAAPAAADDAPTPEAATQAFGQWIQARHPGILDAYWTCPGPAFDGQLSCTAEGRIGDVWHRITATATASTDADGNATVQIAAGDERTWTHRWSRWSGREIAGFGAPGVASVNAPADWSFIAGQAYDAWRHHRRSFQVNGFDGNGAGLDRFVLFGCEVHGAIVRCANSFGDAIRYKPRGGFKLRLSPLGLGPLRIGMTLRAATQAADRPIFSEAGINGCSWWSMDLLPAPSSGTSLLAFNGRLGLVTAGRPLATTRGIRIGDSIGRLRSAYRGHLRRGKTPALFGAPRSIRGLFADQRRHGTTYTLAFAVTHGRVSSMDAGTRHTIETFYECA